MQSETPGKPGYSTAGNASAAAGNFAAGNLAASLAPEADVELSTLTLFPRGSFNLFLPRSWGRLRGCVLVDGGSLGSAGGSVAAAWHVDLVGGVDEAVEDGFGDDGVGEEFVPGFGLAITSISLLAIIPRSPSNTTSKGPTWTRSRPRGNPRPRTPLGKYVNVGRGNT